MWSNLKPCPNYPGDWIDTDGAHTMNPTHRFAGYLDRVRQTLTHRQRKLLAWIHCYRSEHGRSPSMREMAKAMGSPNIKVAADHLKALRAKGCATVDKEPSVARTVIPGGWLLVTAEGEVIPMTEAEAQRLLARLEKASV